MLTETQWSKYLDKYGKLIHMISARISGDEMLASKVDNYQDLCLAALNSIKGFASKTGREFDDFIDDPLFGQYTKTVLWNLKNKKGAGLTDRMPFRNKQFSINSSNNDDDDKNFDIEDPTSLSGVSNTLFNIAIEGIDPDLKKIVDTIMMDSDTIQSNGSLNVMALSRAMGRSPGYFTKHLERLRRKLGNNNE